ncbi:MAG: hypothetical protein ACLQU3_00175 [Limisphaerales bacterium]
MKILDVPQSGTIGTMVSYKTRFGQFRRRYVVPRDPQTSLQVARRKAMGRARFLWRTPTDAQRAAWNAAAHGARTQPRLNQSGALTGYLLFVKINCNRALVGQPLVLDPPDAPQFDPNPVRQLLITNRNGEFALKLRVSGKPAQFVVVLGTKPRSAGVSYVDHFTILDVLPEPVRGLSDITDLYVGKYGVLRAGSRVFIRTFQLIDGWEDLPLQVSAIVPAG